MHTLTDIAPVIFRYPTRTELGKHASIRAADVLRRAIAAKGNARLMLAAAPSQSATLASLLEQPDIDWGVVDCFHMDDYLGLPSTAPQGFGNWLQTAFFDQEPRATFHRMDPSGEPAEEARRYSAVMGPEPFDLVLLGLGVNGHLAFNDPPANFADGRGAKVVGLDMISRQQQVDEGHFATLGDVPATAISVTIPRLLNATDIIASVPGAEKRQAVQDSLRKPISGAHPGTALRTHPSVSIFLDKESDPR
ncbi:6-phosphogluconolactonase [Arthrobacter sp. 4R501]|uniref:6-phosphogluconolactonase n=1 Tax=Arthrobacter sp. 4R501 TaxID=2058886 RepID=UPI000CE5561F|nr:6-phosphogluconolactonase [Arthrobacter sp. 4R501]